MAIDDLLLDQHLRHEHVALFHQRPLAFTPEYEPVRFVELRSVERHATSQSNEGVIRRGVIYVRESKELALRMRMDPAHLV